MLFSISKMVSHEDGKLTDFEYSEARRDMVERQVAARGVRSEAVLSAMSRVPREQFVPEEMREFAYNDSPLPIGEGQHAYAEEVVAQARRAGLRAVMLYCMVHNIEKIMNFAMA